jgi:hypothetical protein
MTKGDSGYRPQVRPKTPEKSETAMDPRPNTESRAGGQAAGCPPAPTDGGTVLRLSTDRLTALALRLRTYLKSPRPAWPEIVDDADWLRGELGVSQSLLGEA